VSKAFTKDDAPDEALVLPSRAPLPAGATNYVTPRGLASLRAELEHLSAERDGRTERVEPAPRGVARATDRARELAVLHARVRELEERIASAIVVAPTPLPRDEVRFGTCVTIRGEAGSDRHYEIVGVDEADASAGRVAFVAPLARALLGKRVGDVVTLRAPRGEEEIEVLAIR
jgi:transcription elongation factor GreB